MNLIAQMTKTTTLALSATLFLACARSATAEIDPGQILTQQEDRVLISQLLAPSEARSNPDPSSQGLANVPTESDRANAELQPLSSERELFLEGKENEPGRGSTSAVSDEVLETLKVSVTFSSQDLFNENAEQDSQQTPESRVPLVAQGRRSLEDYDYSAGLDLPTFGWTLKRDGSIKSVIGLNPTLGFSYRTYFQPVERKKFNWSFDFGTLGLALPYAAIGGDYQSEGSFYIGLHVGGASLWYFEDLGLIPFGWLSLGGRF